MSGNSGSIKAVVFALGSNVLITIIKFIVSAVTHSAGMLAEAIHSFADCGNQVFFADWKQKICKTCHRTTPLRVWERGVFLGVSGCRIAFLCWGCLLNLRRSPQAFNPADLQNISWSFIVLIVSILIEGKSFHVAYTAFKKLAMGWVSTRHSRNRLIPTCL